MRAIEFALEARRAERYCWRKVFVERTSFPRKRRGRKAREACGGVCRLKVEGFNFD